MLRPKSCLGGFFSFSSEIIALLSVSPEHFRQRVMHAHICVSHYRIMFEFWTLISYPPHVPLAEARVVMTAWLNTLGTNGLEQSIMVLHGLSPLSGVPFTLELYSMASLHSTDRIVENFINSGTFYSSFLPVFSSNVTMFSHWYFFLWYKYVINLGYILAGKEFLLILLLPLLFCKLTAYIFSYPNSFWDTLKQVALSP
jgi:hypothetical protein